MALNDNSNLLGSLPSWMSKSFQLLAFACLILRYGRRTSERHPKLGFINRDILEGQTDNGRYFISSNFPRCCWPGGLHKKWALNPVNTATLSGWLPIRTVRLGEVKWTSHNLGGELPFLIFET